MIQLENYGKILLMMINTKTINENKKRPTRKNNNEKTYGTWITLQVKNYKNKQQIMTATNIRKLWEDFINDDKYKNYF